MLHRIASVAITLAITVLATNPVRATDGKLDDNGCHYDRGRGGYHCHEDRPPNPDRFAPVKKSRENQCLDKRSPNYKMTTRFVAYRSMRECVMSGGVEPVFENGGLSDKPWPNL